ncbi:AF1514 family protein [Desulfobacterota bacterium M19]
MRDINLKVEGKALDYRRAADLAEARAEREIPGAMLIAWNDRKRDLHSPSCLKCEINNKAGWEVYGHNHGGRLRISINDDDFVFIYGML